MLCCSDVSVATEGDADEVGSGDECDAEAGSDDVCEVRVTELREDLFVERKLCDRQARR